MKNFEKIYEVVSIKQVITIREDLQRFVIKCPEDIVTLVRSEIADDDREIFLVASLNTKNQVNALHRCHVGSVNRSVVHAREVFKSAILNNATSVVVAHQHPSGDPEPSNEDIEMTNRLVEAGEIIGIIVMDHIIVAPETRDYTSFREEGYIHEKQELFNGFDQSEGQELDVEEDEMEF